jgi:hypothetical protein
MRSDKVRAGFVAAAAIILSCQLFFPPIVGLADQGDFIRIVGRFGYTPEDKSTEYAFLTRKFVPDPRARVAVYEQVTSEYIFVEAAVLLNKVLSKDGKLDLTMIGFVHLIAFLYAFHRLLLAAAPFRVMWVLALLILTDVGYAAYWNSFYAEPASCIFFLLLLSESISICRTEVVSSAQIARWTLWAILFVMAKPQNAPLGFLLALFALRLTTASYRSRLGIGSSILIATASVVGIVTLPVPIGWANTYNDVFLTILPESPAPASDARTLGLSPEWLKYSGTGAWTPGTAYHEAVMSGTIGKTITPGSILHFYLLHPTRIWRHAKRVLPTAFSLRPEWCGNFERSAGLPPGAKSRGFSLWSAFHERVLTACGKLLLIALLMCPVICVAARRRYLEFFAMLSVCCVLSFVVAICGDAWDTVKHLFLFNLLLDTWMMAGLAILAQYVRNVLHCI